MARTLATLGSLRLPPIEHSRHAPVSLCLLLPGLGLLSFYVSSLTSSRSGVKLPSWVRGRAGGGWEPSLCHSEIVACPSVSSSMES